MIVLESKQYRRLAGRLGEGAEVVASVLDLVRNHGLGTAELRGIGYLEDVRLSVWDGEAFHELDACYTGQALSLTGNVSRDESGPSVHLMVQLLVTEEGAQRVVGGRLLSANVIDLEFFIDAIDDFGFVRMGDPEGHMSWLQIDSERHTVHPDEAAPNRTEFLPGRLTSRSDRETEPEYELAPDDTLDHPKLGRCVVVDVPDEDRARIRVERTDRVVELHLGVMRLTRASADGVSPQHFHVRIRKRN